MPYLFEVNQAITCRTSMAYLLMVLFCQPHSVGCINFKISFLTPVKYFAAEKFVQCVNSISFPDAGGLAVVSGRKYIDDPLNTRNRQLWQAFLCRCPKLSRVIDFVINWDKHNGNFKWWKTNILIFLQDYNIIPGINFFFNGCQCRLTWRISTRKPSTGRHSCIKQHFLYDKFIFL